MNPERPDGLVDGAQCPLPLADYPRVVLGHGGGGKLTEQLIEKLFLPAFDNPFLNKRHDGAVLDLGRMKLAFTTDSYVVRPLFFPGGDIGTLAVNGTVNDLAMCGARPAYLSAGFIIEEGFPMETLWAITRSMARAAESAGVAVVTGDTKVVDKGHGDGIFINTAGVGVVERDWAVEPGKVRPGDAIILSGDIGRHGMAILSAREGLAFESMIESDCAPLAGPVLRLIEEGIEIHCLRDLTRGGLGGALAEIARAARVRVDIDESAIPVREDVRGACEILGFDPLYVANEGRFAAFVAGKDAGRAEEILRAFPPCAEAVVIGHVRESRTGLAVMKSRIGSDRVVDSLSGEQMPRIC